MRRPWARYALATVPLLLVSIALTPAQAAWRTISDLNYDDGGHVCTDGMDMGFAEQGSDLKITVTNNTTGQEIVPETAFPLKFRPIPELFNEFIDYRYSANARVLFSPDASPGDEIQIDTDSAATGQSLAIETVEDCTVQPPFLGFYEVKNPPNLNIFSDVVEPNGTIRVKFSLRGDRGLDIFSEGPFRARIECGNKSHTPTLDTSKVAVGKLAYRADTDRYIYRWRPPETLGACQELWFRTAYDGLTHRALFDFRSTA
jgi:hypothetical protein